MDQCSTVLPDVFGTPFIRPPNSRHRLFSHNLNGTESYPGASFLKGWPPAPQPPAIPYPEMQQTTPASPILFSCHRLLALIPVIAALLALPPVQAQIVDDIYDALHNTTDGLDVANFNPVEFTMSYPGGTPIIGSSVVLGNLGSSISDYRAVPIARLGEIDRLYALTSQNSTVLGIQSIGSVAPLVDSGSISDLSEGLHISLVPEPFAALLIAITGVLGILRRRLRCDEGRSITTPPQASSPTFALLSRLCLARPSGGRMDHEKNTKTMKKTQLILLFMGALAFGARSAQAQNVTDFTGFYFGNNDHLYGITSLDVVPTAFYEYLR